MLKYTDDIKSHSPDGIGKIWLTPTNKYYTQETYNDMQLELAKTLPLRLIAANDTHSSKKYYRRREASEVFSIELVLKGSTYFVQNEKKYRVEAGSVFLVHHDRNSEFTTGPEGYCHRLACLLSGHELNGILSTTKLIRQDVIKLNNLEAVEKTMRECLIELKEKKDAFRRRCSVLAYKLLLELEENLQQENIPDLLVYAIDLMGRHLSRQLSLKKMAEALNSAPTSLNRAFQQHFNTSPINYFITLKMENAKSLLLNTDMQIQEIAHNVGYINPLYFSSEFRKRIGVSPREFRKNNVIQQNQ
mgnify:CR=1 FL=1